MFMVSMIHHQPGTNVCQGSFLMLVLNDHDLIAVYSTCVWVNSSLESMEFMSMIVPTAGTGPKYENALRFLQSNFEFRKWRDGVEGGDFCGAAYSQCPDTFVLKMSQNKFIEKLRPMHFSKERLRDRNAPLNDKEISCLRAINGSLNWLATQSRPDLSTQVSFSQQAFPVPTVADALAANNAVRREKQHRDQEVIFAAFHQRAWRFCAIQMLHSAMQKQMLLRQGFWLVLPTKISTKVNCVIGPLCSGRAPVCQG